MRRNHVAVCHVALRDSVMHGRMAPRGALRRQSATHGGRGVRHTRTSGKERRALDCRTACVCVEDPKSCRPPRAKIYSHSALFVHFLIPHSTSLRILHPPLPLCLIFMTPRAHRLAILLFPNSAVPHPIVVLLPLLHAFTASPLPRCAHQQLRSRLRPGVCHVSVGVALLLIVHPLCIRRLLPTLHRLPPAPNSATVLQQRPLRSESSSAPKRPLCYGEAAEFRKAPPRQGGTRAATQWLRHYLFVHLHYR